MLTDDGEARPALSHIQPISEEELLGRPPSEIDTDAVANYITGRRVLVTGAGGSIGSELCRQLARFDPAALYMLDRDESGLHATQLSIDGRALLDSPELVLADLRDPQRLVEVFDACRPEVVFHAAALKHLTLLEQAPAEAWKTNVVGTQHLIELCELYGVSHFVNISTDKAADPGCVLGYTKRITERLTASAAQYKSHSVYLSVRFGNVLGSRGSVLTAFSAQSQTGGPMTVTDPDVTRYFMTIEEASRLTIYAGAIGRPGEALVLDMGEPVRIMDVAQRFANRHTPPLEIVFTGLRPGEKLHEVLLSTEEHDERPVHELISHVAVPPLSWECCQQTVTRRLGERPIDAEVLADLSRAEPARSTAAAS
jgi:FlaA1/EpsC-like NDP-sugar epimerase